MTYDVLKPAYVMVKAKQSHYRNAKDQQGSRRLRLPDFKTVGT